TQRKEADSERNNTVDTGDGDHALRLHGDLGLPGGVGDGPGEVALPLDARRALRPVVVADGARGTAGQHGEQGEQRGENPGEPPAGRARRGLRDPCVGPDGGCGHGLSVTWNTTKAWLASHSAQQYCPDGCPRKCPEAMPQTTCAAR